jgi:hypothetical protein
MKLLAGEIHDGETVTVTSGPGGLVLTGGLSEATLAA